jgi:hypothetical protein
MGLWFPTSPRPGEASPARFQVHSGALGRVWASGAVSGPEGGSTSCFGCIDKGPPLATHDVVFGNTPRSASSRPQPIGRCRPGGWLWPTHRRAPSHPSGGTHNERGQHQENGARAESYSACAPCPRRGRGLGQDDASSLFHGGGEVRERVTAGAGWWPRAGSSSIGSSVVWRPAPRCVARSLVAEDVSRMRVRRSGAYQTAGIRKLQSQKCHFCAGNKGSRLSVCGLPSETRKQPQAGVRSGRRTRR